MVGVQIILNSLIAGSIYSLNACGFTLIYGSMGFFNMAYGANVMIGAYVFYAFYRIYAFPVYISIILACLITSLIMLLIDRTCYHGLRQKQVPTWTPVVVSMSISTIILGIVTMVFGSAGLSVFGGIPGRINIFGAYITVIQAIMFFSAISIMIGFTLYLKKSKTGKLIRALSNDKQLALVVGINVEKVYMAIIIAGSFLATIAGVFYGLDSNIRPYMSVLLMTKAIVISIIGGVGDIKGTMRAGFIFGFIENISTLIVGSGWRDAVPLLVILFVMLLKPSVYGIEEEKI